MTTLEKIVESLLKVSLEQNEIMQSLNDRLTEAEVKVLKLEEGLQAVSRKTAGLTMIGGAY